MDELSRLSALMRFTNSWQMLLVPVVLMGADFLSGFLGAWARKDIQSSALREGIVHKCGEMLIVIISIFLMYAISIPRELVIGIIVYICLMECISILENLGKSGCHLPPALLNHLKVLTDETEETENEQEK